MNEEELFCKLFPEYAVNGKPLSPYFDLFERGYEEAENRAEELEKSCEETQELLDKQIEATYKLDKENAELKKEIRCECTRCVYSDSPCIRSDYGVENDEDVCPNYENIFVAYTQLKEENAELKKELKEWKDEWQEQVQKATDEGYARTLQTIQLSKAKELLKEFVQHYKAKTIYVENMQDLLEQSEQFISEVGK